MELLGKLALAGVVVNFLVFIAGGKLFFDGSKRQKSFTAFAATYVSLFLLTATFQYLHPCSDAWRNGVSVAVLATSLALFGKTVATTIRHPFSVIFSEGSPTQLVTHGPYHYVRHPFYTAYLMTFFASALASDHLAPAACSLVAIGIYWNAAKTEEKKFLASELGGAYAALQGRTGMFLPRLTRNAGAQP